MRASFRIRAKRKLGSLLDRALGRQTIVIGNDQPIDRLNEWQSVFCQWQAEQRGVPEPVMRERLLASLNAIRGGHGGSDYRRFDMLNCALLLPFAADTEAEVREAYDLHARGFFLRMLSYPVPELADTHPLVAALGPLSHVRIIDFGCGLAQKSVALARKLQRQGKAVQLCLADVQPLQLAFISWFCANKGIPATTFLCTAERPIPDFRPAHVLFAEEVLEHVHDPFEYFERLDGLLLPGGHFLADVSDHQAEFMHVFPQLRRVRARILDTGYTEVTRNKLFRKPLPDQAPLLRQAG